MTIGKTPRLGTALDDYFARLAWCLSATSATGANGELLALDQAIQAIIDRATATHAAGGKLFFIGNGGSAAIASHAAIDFAKAGGFRALALTDGAVVTCLSNDLGYDQVFAFQLRSLGLPGDLLIATSSSGQSRNILEAVAAAREHDMAVVTLSGFQSDNPLRYLGDINVHVPSGHYGMVELSHQALVHAILDLYVGWPRSESAQSLPRS